MELQQNGLKPKVVKVTILTWSSLNNSSLILISFSLSLLDSRFKYHFLACFTKSNVWKRIISAVFVSTTKGTALLS